MTTTSQSASPRLSIDKALEYQIALLQRQYAEEVRALSFDAELAHFARLPLPTFTQWRRSEDVRYLRFADAYEKDWQSQIAPSCPVPMSMAAQDVFDETFAVYADPDIPGWLLKAADKACTWFQGILARYENTLIALLIGGSITFAFWRIWMGMHR